MPDLLWPGDHRAGDHLSEAEVVRAMLRVETAWLAALVSGGVAPPEAAIDLGGCVSGVDTDLLAAAAEAGGNPVIPLVTLLRERLAHEHPEAARWVHRGLTSQDVLDTALTLALRDAVDVLLDELDSQVVALVDLSQRHRADPMAGRTLTQHAVPTTFGLKAAHWLHGILDARDDLRLERGRLPAQLGGAAGTLAATAELLRLTGGPEDALGLAGGVAAALDLPFAPPWHTVRAPLTRVADALVRASDAWGRIAGDVLVLARPEIGELAESRDAERGGSSTLPGKRNPILAVLVRRAALTAPSLAAQLHLAAAMTVDERADGAWHTEWSPLVRLGRHAVTAAKQTTELLAGLHVDTERMTRHAHESASTLLAEQCAMAALVGVRDERTPDLGDYLGATDALIDTLVERARTGPDR